MGRFKILSLPATAMFPRQFRSTTPCFPASHQTQQPFSLIQTNQQATNLFPSIQHFQPSLNIFPQAFNYPRLLQHQVPIFTPAATVLRTPYCLQSQSYASTSFNMGKSSKRKSDRRNVSFHPYAAPPLCKTHEMDKSQEESRERKHCGIRVSVSRGLTQADWPKSSAECEWRRGPRNGLSRPPTPPGTSHTVLQGSRENAPPLCPPVHQSSQSLPHQPARCLHSSSQSHHSDSHGTVRKRSWFHVPQHKDQKKFSSSRRNSVDFSVVSYNVLAQSLLQMNRHLYRHCDQDVLVWDHRKNRLLEELRRSNADVICLQEVESSHFQDFFQPALQELGYASIFKKRTGDKRDGCATFFKTSCFTEVAHTKLEYQREIGILDRDNVAIVVTLQLRGLSSSHQLCVANTHLLWNPRRGDIKLAQLGLLFAEIERLSCAEPASHKHTCSYHPVVLCGDFNSVPHSPLYKFIKEGEITYQGMPAVDVSGQEEGRNVPMESPLWPREIGVSENCCYVRDLASSASSGEAGRRKRRKSRDGSVDENIQPSPDQGQLIHPFSFFSVYDHCHGYKEVTTNHSRTNCTVDYIFYSKSGQAGHVDKPGGQPNFTGQLSIVKRLTLFSDSDVTAMGGLPNLDLPSDHISLQATLRLSV